MLSALFSEKITVEKSKITFGITVLDKLILNWSKLTLQTKISLLV